MIDIHCHALYGVDDGAVDREMSIGMLKDAAAQGVTAIVLTPHYRKGMFSYPLEKIQAAYQDLYEEAENIGLSLYSGCEYHVDSDMGENFNQGRCLTLAGSDYVLAEYGYETTYDFIRKSLNNLAAHGYSPVIAHAERYEVFIKKPQLLREMRDMGAKVQINADSVIGKEGFWTKQLCKKIIKEHLLDIVASDSHNMTDRGNHMKECYLYIAKKFGEERAKKLMEINPGKIIE
ncbi:MAG: capsular biosynthesis protein [Lachnospiraceae bacterium]|nr:capsular biosynthesis protein [Lachnospiraceae bacterium]